eukprot:365292-Chlamydomonas_euryale.AAC.3
MSPTAVRRGAWQCAPLRRRQHAPRLSSAGRASPIGAGRGRGCCGRARGRALRIEGRAMGPRGRGRRPCKVGYQKGTHSHPFRQRGRASC